MTVKVLFLVTRLDSSGPARQVQLLATGLDRADFETCVCTLQAGGDSVQLRAAGIKSTTLCYSRLLDPFPWWRLRRLLHQFQPDVVHVFGPRLLRLLRLADIWNRRPVVCSAPFLSPPGPGLVERWLLRGVDRVVARTQSEAERCRQLGVGDKQVVVMPPAVPLLRWASPCQPANAVPENARCIAWLGRLEKDQGCRKAIWAFDILRYLFHDLHLLISGDGPERARLADFARNIHCDANVHFLGSPSAGPALARAEIVWVPDRPDGGVQAALDAMAVGRPVVASDAGPLPEVVIDGQTGLLVPLGPPATLARQTRTLLDDTDLARRLGEAGRQRVREHFSSSELVRRAALLYQEVVSGEW